MRCLFISFASMKYLRKRWDMSEGMSTSAIIQLRSSKVLLKLTSWGSNVDTMPHTVPMT